MLQLCFCIFLPGGAGTCMLDFAGKMQVNRGIVSGWLMTGGRRWEVVSKWNRLFFFESKWDHAKNALRSRIVGIPMSFDGYLS